MQISEICGCVFGLNFTHSVFCQRRDRQGGIHIEQAARAAQAHEFILELEDGYDTIIGERGVSLSGGQRQRLAIARAFLMNPRILILDDATASVDSQTERLIREAMRRLCAGRTTFVIAHRLSTIQAADQILVLEGGAIVERGTHRELLDQHGRYRQLYDKQYGFERDRFINPGEDFTPEPPKADLPAPRPARGFGAE